MSHAHTIAEAFRNDSTLALEAARTIGIIDEDQLWMSETTVLTLEDGSKIAFDSDYVWEVAGRKQEVLVELMLAKQSGVTLVWYGNIENASIVDIDDAIRDISKMDDDAVGDGDWGEWEG